MLCNLGLHIDEQNAILLFSRRTWTYIAFHRSPSATSGLHPRTNPACVSHHDLWLLLGSNQCLSGLTFGSCFWGRVFFSFPSIHKSWWLALKQDMVMDRFSLAIAGGGPLK